MLVARQGRRHRAWRATYKRDESVALLLSASESAAAPASVISLSFRLQRGEEGQACHGETGPQAQSRARATYVSEISVVLVLSASDSAAAPASPIWLPFMLLRGEQGQ
jgi:hypothetical protein